MADATSPLKTLYLAILVASYLLVRPRYVAIFFALYIILVLQFLISTDPLALGAK